MGSELEAPGGLWARGTGGGKKAEERNYIHTLLHIANKNNIGVFKPSNLTPRQIHSLYGINKPVFISSIVPGEKQPPPWWKHFSILVSAKRHLHRNREKLSEGHEWHYRLSEGSWVTLQAEWGQFTRFSGSVSGWSVAPMSTGPSRTAFLSDLYEKVTFRPPSSSEPLPPSSPETTRVERETQEMLANHHTWTTEHLCAWMLLSNQYLPIWAEIIKEWGNYVTVLLHQRMQR